MTLIHTRYNNALKWEGNLPPLVKKMLVKVREEARELHVVFGKNQSFEVVYENTKVNVVDLGKKECDCSNWQVSGLPCKHAMC